MSDEGTGNRELSRTHWRVKNTTNDEINLGSFQRMADSLEIITKDKTELLGEIERLKKDRDCYKRWYYEKIEDHKRTIKSRDAYKGLYLKAKRTSKILTNNF